MALISSRIVSQNEILLIFDNLTAVLWKYDSDQNDLGLLMTSYSTEYAYLCYGINEGIDTMSELIDFDKTNRVLTLKDNSGESLTAFF